ncbi:uncharacterized protein LOC111376897 [Olea europaea var. sylvestris]|uniref:uncharacterized protein LOC111376897 n=1 Tax=Olea europaea var. sylvestris TaxID=158386 RepID=UPI000C1CD7DA|nr:uncharacterized protein LOC111376897 [Olea europaea var. sylvestris]
MYVKIETARLDYFRNNQKQIRAEFYQDIVSEMPTSLRRLFATLLMLCNPDHPKLLWDKFKVYITDDYIHDNISSKGTELQALKDIGLILESLGKNINDYKIVSFSVNIDENERLRRMMVDDIGNLDIEGGFACTTSLNNEQQFAYDTIMKKVNSKSSGVYFIDGTGGVALLACVRSQNLIVLATTSSGVYAFLLLRGRTAHSRFKIPLEIIGEISCSVSKQSALGTLLKMSTLILWDEAHMVNRCAVEAVNKMLRDITDSNLPFGGKVVVLGGDFRQVLLLIPKGKKEDIIRASLVFSDLWPLYSHLPLVENMRAKFDPTFCDYLLRIVNGMKLEHNCNCIQLPHNIIVPFEDEITSLKFLISHVFPNIEAYVDNLHVMANRVILTPRNECVDNINRILLDQNSGQIYTYYSFDEAIDKLEQSLYENFLNTLTPNGIPPYELKLKINCFVMLLRNINPSERLCNGTRFTCRKFDKNVILVEITNVKSLTFWISLGFVLLYEFGVSCFFFKCEGVLCNICSKEEPNVVHCDVFTWICIYLYCRYWWTNFSEGLFKSSKFMAKTSGGSDPVCLSSKKKTCPTTLALISKQ